MNSAGAVTITTNDNSGTDADVTIDGGTTALHSCSIHD